MSRPRLIGITGKAYSGKDTLADALVAEFGAVKYAFALPIKLALNAMFGWSMANWDDRFWKETIIPWLGKSPRQAAQTLGTEWGRELIHPELWALRAMELYAAHAAKSDDPFIISDVRFNNEAMIINHNGGVVINVVRPGATAISAHVSEQGVDHELLDCQVINDGSVVKYVHQAINMLDRNRRGERVPQS